MVSRSQIKTIMEDKMKIRKNSIVRLNYQFDNAVVTVDDYSIDDDDGDGNDRPVIEFKLEDGDGYYAYFDQISRVVKY